MAVGAGGKERVAEDGGDGGGGRERRREAAREVRHGEEREGRERQDPELHQQRAQRGLSLARREGRERERTRSIPPEQQIQAVLKREKERSGRVGIVGIVVVVVVCFIAAMKR